VPATTALITTNSMFSLLEPLTNLCFWDDAWVAGLQTAVTVLSVSVRAPWV
jgi:hypothetical protein